MHTEVNPVLEDILSCADLPSLPAIALRVIDLTSDVNVSLSELASTIQNDQGLSSKILKTVNSSFYGLRRRCGTIEKALVLLGLGPVKSLALGFSLVTSIDDPADESQFDYLGYWRRGLYGAVAGKLIADRLTFDFSDEVFLGGLLQDVGMIAMYRALGDQYLATIAAARGDHREVVSCELREFDLQHPEVGAMLVQRWRLPEELVLPVKYHERPSAAPAGCVDHVRCVGLGGMVHDVLSVADSTAVLRKLYERAKAWYKLDSGAVDEIVERAGEAAHELASVFKIDVGPFADAEEVLTQAGNRMVEMTREEPNAGSALVKEGSVLAGSECDPLTGALGQLGFESAIREGFGFAVENQEPLTLMQVVIDGFAGLPDQFGPGSELEAVMGVAALLKRSFEGHGGVVCRVSEDTLAIVLPSMGRRTAMRLVDAFQADLRRASASWLSPESQTPMPVTACVGVASFEEDTRATIDEAAKLVVACARALKAAQGCGEGSVRVFQPRSRAA